MIWPPELKDDGTYDNIKSLCAKIEETELFSRVEVKTYEDWDIITRKRFYKFGYIVICSKSKHSHYFNYFARNELCAEFYKISKTGKSAVKCKKTITINSDNAVEEIKNIISLDIQASEFLTHKAHKMKQVNSITSIIVDGLCAKYPKVKIALSAARRAKSSLSYSFKNENMIIKAKLTIEDKTKLDKLFEVLNEII